MTGSELDRGGPTTESGTFLIAFHGRGRGSAPNDDWAEVAKAVLTGGPWRRPKFMDQLVRSMEAHHRGLATRIRAWETGTPLPDLSGVRAVMFRMQDPLKERFPRCYAEAVQLAERCRATGIHIVNPPEALSNTIKSRQSQLWLEAGIETPKVVPYGSYEEMLDVRDQVQFPAFLRADLLHVQRMFLASSAEDVVNVDSAHLSFPGCYSPLVDTRSGYRVRNPRSDFARYYHKKRVWVAGDEVQRAHIFFADGPIVGSGQSTFSHYQSLSLIDRALGKLKSRNHVKLDYQFFKADEERENTDLFVRATRALNLDVAAIDYATTADGQQVLWEANPYFAVEQWPLDLLRRDRRTEERYDAFYLLIGNYISALLRN